MLFLLLPLAAVWAPWLFLRTSTTANVFLIKWMLLFVSGGWLCFASNVSRLTVSYSNWPLEKCQCMLGMSREQVKPNSRNNHEATEPTHWPHDDRVFRFECSIMHASRSDPMGMHMRCLSSAGCEAANLLPAFCVSFITVEAAAAGTSRQWWPPVPLEGI